jgi:hypothetical protein
MAALHFLAKRALDRTHPKCLSCWRPLTDPPDAKTFTRRGSFDVIVEWRTCTCGAFWKTQRIRQVPVNSRR